SPRGRGRPPRRLALLRLGPRDLRFPSRSRKDPKGMPMKTACMNSPFQKKSFLEKRLKILVLGESGSGKTRFLLSLPRLALIDTEHGTDHYSGDYAIASIHGPDEVRGAVEWLERGEHEFSTLAIDSFSVVWDAFQRKWSEIFLERLGCRRASKHEFFDLGPRE